MNKWKAKDVSIFCYSDIVIHTAMINIQELMHCFSSIVGFCF